MDKAEKGPILSSNEDFKPSVLPVAAAHLAPYRVGADDDPGLYDLVNLSRRYLKGLLTSAVTTMETPDPRHLT